MWVIAFSDLGGTHVVDVVGAQVCSAPEWMVLMMLAVSSVGFVFHVVIVFPALSEDRLEARLLGFG